LYYYGARWYDPTIGRFISQDPSAGSRADPQSLNSYLYVETSPATNSDPTGECPWCIAVLIGSGIGAAVGYGWCVADREGWTSSACGEAALGGTVVGALAGLALGLSLIAAPELRRFPLAPLFEISIITVNEQSLCRSKGWPIWTKLER